MTREFQKWLQKDSQREDVEMQIEKFGTELEECPTVESFLGLIGTTIMPYVSSKIYGPLFDDDWPYGDSDYHIRKKLVEKLGGPMRRLIEIGCDVFGGPFPFPDHSYIKEAKAILAELSDFYREMKSDRFNP